MPLLVRPFQPEDRLAWDEFVLQHPHGTPFHLTAWRDSICQTFGYQPLYLAAFSGTDPCGVLPLFLIRNLLMGRVLLSTPFAVYGGILAMSEEARSALAEALVSLAAEREVDYVELRNWQPAQCCGFSPVERYVHFAARLGGGESALLESIPRKTRYMVRKALREPFTVRRQRSDSSAFEQLYAENLRRLGTPCFPGRHFTRLLANFRGAADIREVLLEGRVVAAVLSLYFGGRVLPYYGASDPRYLAAAPNNFMYFDLMRWADREGYSAFDFGRSRKGSGSYEFKTHWGMEERALPYEVLLLRRKTMPNYSPDHRRLKVVTRCWRHVPLPITRVLGPALIKLVP